MATPKHQIEWDAKNCTQFKIKLNNNTDAELIAYIKSLDNKQGYIKELIKADMMRKQQP